MLQPKITVVIPVYNVAPYITRSLESIANQTYKNIEVIFVDDCGVDNSAEIIYEYMSDTLIDCKLLRHSCNRGLSAARNTGLEAATGDYVYFLDSDDDITPDCIESLVAPLNLWQYDVVVGDYNVIGGGCYSPLVLPEGPLYSNDDIIKAYAEGKWYVMAWNKLCRREFLLRNKLFFKEGLIHEDVLWTFMVACKANSLYVVRQPVYNYYVRSASIMTSMSIEKDANIYVEVFDNISTFVRIEQLEYGGDQYAIIEGKKSGILYSLLQKDESELYKKIYLKFRKLPFANPVKAFRYKTIGFGYLIRDFHYILPQHLGALYKKLFYLAVYKWRGRAIEGAVWG